MWSTCMTPKNYFAENYRMTSWSQMIVWISVGNCMICSDIWHKYHEWYFEIGEWNLRQFWNITSGIYAKDHVQIMLLFVYTTVYKSFVTFTCRHFKLSWNTTALSQSNWRNFSRRSIKGLMPLPSLHKAKMAKSPVNSTSNFQKRK